MGTLLFSCKTPISKFLVFFFLSIFSFLVSDGYNSSDYDLYNRCGKFGVCSVLDNVSSCRCIRGFQPTDWDQWRVENWSDGCSRNTLLKCQRNSTEGEDGFVVLKQAKLPASPHFVPGPDEDCEETCLRNCSCTAYSFVQGIGCLIWAEDLLGVQQFTKGGTNLNIHLARSNLSGKLILPLSFIVLSTKIGTRGHDISLKEEVSRCH
ncbi:hypothetical protein CerSpe_242450 [Prunus speciosa]